MTSEDKLREAEWQETKKLYSEPDSTIDIGNMYWWAEYWYQRATTQHDAKVLKAIAFAVSAIECMIDEYGMKKEVLPAYYMGLEALTALNTIMGDASSQTGAINTPKPNKADSSAPTPSPANTLGKKENSHDR